MRLLDMVLAGSAIVMLSTVPNTAQERTAVSTAASISDLAWLAGQWVQDTSAMSVEESWSAPAPGGKRPPAMSPRLLVAAAYNVFR